MNKLLEQVMNTYKEGFKVKQIDRDTLTIQVKTEANEGTIYVTETPASEIHIYFLDEQTQFESYPVEVFNIHEAWDKIDLFIYLLTGQEQ